MRRVGLLLVVAGCEGTSVTDSAVCGGPSCQAIYVSTAGDDGAAGTSVAPLRTIGAGIARAGLGMPKKAVFVQAGVYAESIAMAAGVGVFGGLDAS